MVAFAAFVFLVITAPIWVRIAAALLATIGPLVGIVLALWVAGTLIGVWPV
jgi:hypothetical protein